ncbi:MAG: OadG family protein [Eubacterium sp.]|nr:OadG family protein [Eubacterium sp.]
MNKKIKKMLLLVLVLTFSLIFTGCGEEELNYQVNEKVMQQYTKQIIDQYKDVEDYEEDYYLNEGTELEKSAVAGFKAAQTTDHVGAYLDSNGPIKISNGVDGKINFSQICHYENREVRVTVSYKENKAFEMDKAKVYYNLSEAAAQYGMDAATYAAQMFGQSEDFDMSSMDKFLESYLIKNGEYPYIAEECEVSAVYNKKELVSMAGKNTAIGMGVVFCVLIFISFIISLLKYLPMIFDADIRKARAEKKAAQEKAKKSTEKMIIGKSAEAAKTEEVKTVAAKTSDDNLMNDAELVAVITAAINAANEFGGVRAPAYTASNDKLVVRSIRRAKR